MLGDWVQKAVYLGVGLASYAGEKAGEAMNDLPTKLQELTDELVARGEMTTEEARRYVDGMLNQSENSPPESSGPQEIEILEAEVDETSN
jgi:polyhydroxyalkanoate synthesis regulator phasin